MRFTFDIAGIKEIHTEVYAYGHIYSFTQTEGLRIAPVSQHWLYETTKGQFGTYSSTENSIGQRFINFIDRSKNQCVVVCYLLKFNRSKIINRIKGSCMRNSQRLSDIAFDK